MKLLFVSLFLPGEKATHAGGRYVYEIIKNLSRRHEIHLASRVEECEIPALEGLRPYCRKVYPYSYRTKDESERGLPDLIRLGLNYIGFSRYAAKLARSGRFDMVQVEWVESALMIGKGRTPMILDAHDVITKPAERTIGRVRGIERFLALLRYRVTRAVERRIMKRFDMVFTLSEYDRDYLLGIDAGLRVKTVPVPAGMDLAGRNVAKEADTILFLASYKYRKANVDAALYFYREVFPLVRKTRPGARFIIAGYGPPVDLTSLPGKDPMVTVTGFVENTEEWYKKASVFVAPVLVGGGIIVKVLDAMAAGAPVVTTPYGNEGIGAVPGRDLLVADGAEAFAAAVLGVLGDRELAENLSQGGRAFVNRHFSLAATMNQIESAYEELLEGYRRKG
ncbi:MAG: glycosyltransferase family 4 protein [Nitrospirae bacterium]|nr:glycosyltransferase family 4 protein [Nitrospirota bacterium]